MQMANACERKGSIKKFASDFKFGPYAAECSCHSLLGSVRKTVRALDFFEGDVVMWYLYIQGYKSASLRSSEKSEDLPTDCYAGQFRKLESIEKKEAFFAFPYLYLPLKALIFL